MCPAMESCRRVDLPFNGWPEEPMSRADCRGPQRGERAGTGAGSRPRASLGTSRGRRPSPETQSVPAAGNAENSSASSSKTALFIGSGRESSWMTSPSSSPSPSTGTSRTSSRSRWSVMCGRCRRSQQEWFAAGCHGLVGRMPRNDQPRAGSRGTGTPSRAQPAGSTWCCGMSRVGCLVCS